MTTKKTPKTPKKSKADNANEANEADTANKANTAPVDEKTLRKQVAAATRTPEQHRLALKDKVRMFYDLQSMRLVNSGRIYKRPEGSTIYLHEADLAILERRAQEMHSAERNALRDVADQVVASGVERVLEPMPPADRKVVHDTVNAIAGVSTTSEGEEPRRRVVIRPDAAQD